MIWRVKRPVVCLDCVAPNNRGEFMGNFVHARELATALARRADLELVLLVDKFTRPVFEALDLGVELLGCEPPRKNKLTDQLAVSQALARRRPDIYHKPNGQLPLTSIPCPAVVTIADLNFKRLPCGPVARLYKEIGYRSSVQRARAVVCISEFTRSEVHHFYPASRHKTVVILHGTNVLPPPPAATTHAMAGHWFLTFGQHRYKNVAVCLRALARLNRAHDGNRTPIGLVVVGAGAHIENHAKPLAQELGVSERVAFAGRVSDEELHGLYRAASGLLFMSHYEGFGLPVLEAMQAGCPVVASNASSIPEVAGDAAVLLAPEDDGALAGWMEILASDETKRTMLRNLGEVRATKFSWDRAAEETVDIYHRVLDADQP